MKQISEILPPTLSTISPTAKAEESDESPGRGLGKPGSGTSLATIDLNLQTAKPAEIDRAMEAWLPRSVATSIRSRIDMSDDPHRMGEILGWDITGEIPRDDAAAALEILNALMQPATPQDVQVELAKLRAVTASAKSGENDTKFLLLAYAEMLEDERYPIDVIRQARKDAAAASKFWPSFADFKRIADGYFMKRKALYLGLRRALAR